MKTLTMLGTALLLLGAAAACKPETKTTEKPVAEAPQTQAPVEETPVKTPDGKAEEKPATTNDEAHPAALPEVRYYVLSDA